MQQYLVTFPNGTTMALKEKFLREVVDDGSIQPTSTIDRRLLNYEQNDLSLAKRIHHSTFAPSR